MRGHKAAQEREGIVVRSLCGSISFKALNNDLLLAEQERPEARALPRWPMRYVDLVIGPSVPRLQQ